MDEETAVSPQEAAVFLPPPLWYHIHMDELEELLTKTPSRLSKLVDTLSAILDEELDPLFNLALVSEMVLAQDWDKLEEETAWQHLA
ncbi:MAG: hypothetical protein IPL28_08410 [Chloroflexi bacterium]|nr:hypothetical protein [Chloroflexota bacterium]